MGPRKLFFIKTTNKRVHKVEIV